MKEIKINYSKVKSIRGRAVLWLLKRLSPMHAWFNQSRQAWCMSSDDMLRFAKGSLGNELGLFYKQYQFEPVDKAERHDVFHVLLNYSTDVKDESAMQFFLWGNGKPSLFTIGTCLISAILFPLDIAYFIKAYKRGKRATPIRSWDFKMLLPCPVNQLKQQIFKQSAL